MMSISDTNRMSVVIAMSLCGVVQSCVYCRGVEPPQSPLSKLNNGDIAWADTPFGLSPKMSERATKALRQIGPANLDELLIMIRDKERFAVAHVMLAEVFQIRDTTPQNAFFGLRVKIDAQGESSYPKYEPETLGRYWMDVNKKHVPKFLVQEPD